MGRLEMKMFHIDNPGEVLSIPVDTILLSYRGSIAHNMYVPSTDPNSIDDVDLIGVNLAPAECYIGLSEWGSRGTKDVKEGKYDSVFYELTKAVRLLLQGNPNIVGMLWTQKRHVLYCSEVGNLLRENRHIFVGKHIYNSFAGYAHAQFEKMETRDPEELRRYLAVTAELKYRGSHPNHKGEQFDRLPSSTGLERDVEAHSTEKLLQQLTSFQKKGENIGYMGDKRKRLVLEHGYDSKNAAHCIRLLRMCKEFLATGEMVVYRESDAVELLDIKRGKWTLDQVKEHALGLFEEIKAERDKSELPAEPDYAAAEKLVVGVLRSHIATTDAGN